MSTITRTYTRTDISNAFEYFQAELRMLALRTQAMESDHAHEVAQDICLMAQEECLDCVHVQLRDSNEHIVKAHRYTVHKDIRSDSQRPGENRWPCLPNGILHVIVSYSDKQKSENLKRSGRLKINWAPSSLSTDYSRMKNGSSRLYSSNSYGLRRDTFIN